MGTSSNRYWKSFTAAFGWGFEANVCDLYEELARNYNLGDRIYLFGFSRGAATIRAFTGFIDACGLLNRFNDSGELKDEALFQQQLDEAIKAYRKIKSDPKIAKQYKQKLALDDINFAPDGNLKIEFVGAWDTISALGFPEDWPWVFDRFFKVLDQIADQFFPHTYYNYNITKATQYGYQALSIDDARATFRPRVWIEEGRESSSVEQVWFAGVHSNVGGGYPRAGLSDVALDWMMEKSVAHGLKFIDGAYEAVKSAANEQGKMYDSRDGFGMYYRYQPRIIEDLCKTDKDKKNPGKDKLNGPVKIHDTVANRVERGTARYAPSHLPPTFDIVGTSPETESKHVVLEEEEWRKCQQEVKVWVKKRQYLYHAFVETTFLLILLSIFLWISPPESVTQMQLNCCGGVTNQCLIKPIADLLHYIFPALFENFITYVVCVYPILFFLMITILVTMFFKRSAYLKGLTKANEGCRKILMDKIFF